MACCPHIRSHPGNLVPYPRSQRPVDFAVEDSGDQTRRRDSRDGDKHGDKNDSSLGLWNDVARTCKEGRPSAQTTRAWKYHFDELSPTAARPYTQKCWQTRVQRISSEPRTAPVPRGVPSVLGKTSSARTSTLRSALDLLKTVLPFPLKTVSPIQMTGANVHRTRT